MNIFNKIIVVILLLFLAVASIVSVVNIFANLYDISDVAGRIVDYFKQANQFILALVFLVILVVSLLLLVFEFYRRKVKVASISSDQSGRTMITLKTVSNQVKDRLSKLENVIDPRVTIVPKGDGIIIDIFSALVKGDNVTQRTEEIRKTATDFATEKLGFKVLRTNYTATSFTAPKEEAKQEPAKEEEAKQEPAEEEPEETGDENRPEQ